jgi:ABC-type transport system involved in cytochrome bd biosynthesis fused ATPase/permease subunit
VYLTTGIPPFLRPVRGLVAAVAVLALAASALSIGVAFGLAAVVRALLRLAENPGADVAPVPLLVVTVACALGRAACLWARDQMAMATAARVKRSVRDRVMAELYELGPGYAGQGGRGGLQITAVDGVEHLQGYVTPYRRGHVLWLQYRKQFSFLIVTGAQAGRGGRRGG